MTITRINEDTLMFELKHEEVPVQDEEALIYYVLDLAVTAEKLDIKNSAVLLELTRSAHGLVFMLTVRKKRKHYKILRKNSTAIFGFERLDDFLSCIFAMYRANMNYPESSTYLMSDRYYLCVKGVGTGATVGKPGGMATAQKSGIGYAAARLGKLEVGVAVVVNALGDIYQDGVKIAGMTTADRKGFVSAEQALLMNQYSDLIAGNTTIAAVFTNAPLSVADLQKVANIASTGMARCIRPVFTMADGDTVYAISLSGGDIKSDVNTIGVLASLVMEKAIADAIFSSKISEEEYLANI